MTLFQRRRLENVNYFFVFFLLLHLRMGESCPYVFTVPQGTSQTIPSHNQLPFSTSRLFVREGRARLMSPTTHTLQTSLLPANGSLNYLHQVHWSNVNTLQPAKDGKRLVVMDAVNLKMPTTLMRWIYIFCIKIILLQFPTLFEIFLKWPWC